MSRGYIERRHCPSAVPLKQQPNCEQPVATVLVRAAQIPESETLTSRCYTPSSGDCRQKNRVARLGLCQREVGVSPASSDKKLSRYGSCGDTSDSSSYSSSLCTGSGGVTGSQTSPSDPHRRLYDGTALDFLGCRQVSVLAMDSPKSAAPAGAQTPRNTLSKATGLSLSVPPSSDKKALESTDGNWMLKSEALAEAEKAKVRSLHARNIVVSNKLSEAKKAEERKRLVNGGEPNPLDRSASDAPSPVHSPTSRVPAPHQFHSVSAKAYSGNHGIRVESPQRPSILARDEMGNLFLVPVLDSATHSGQKRILSRTSSGSGTSPGSALPAQNEAFVFTVASRHSNSTPDLLDKSILHGATLSPYVAKGSRPSSHSSSVQTLPRKLNETKYKVRSPEVVSNSDYLYSTMPRNVVVKGEGTNVYSGAVVRVQVPGHTPKYLKHSHSVDTEHTISRHAQYAQRRSKSTGHELDRTENVSGAELRYIDAEVHIDGISGDKKEKKHRKNRNKSTGVIVNNEMTKTSQKKTDKVSRENTPRTVTLQKGRNGFGFVLRGAKSSTLDFKPTADFPALQYLDRINGENVVNATHEHTVSLIKNSGDVLDMKVITVKPLTHEVLDQRHIHADGTRTLPYKKKAPKPPIRSPQTFLSDLNKDPVFSSIDDFAVLDGLDRTLARYDTEADRQSLGNASDSYVLNNVVALRGVDQQNKTASISRRIKRLSSTPLEGIFERQGGDEISVDQSASHQPKPVVVGAQKVYASPQEARIKQNGGMNTSYSHHVSQIDVRDGDPDSQSLGNYSDVGSNIANVRLSTVTTHDKIYHTEQASDGIYSVPYKHHQPGGLSVKISENNSGNAIPPRPTRAAPPTPPISGGRNVIIPPPPSHAPPETPHSAELGQVVPIQTHQHQYANVSEEIQRQRSGTDSDSSFESSFRPGNKAYVAKEPVGAPGQGANHSRHSSGTSSLSSSTSNHGEYQLSNISANVGHGTKSSHLVSADVHSATPSEVLEPEPDYDKQEATPKMPRNDIPSLRSLREVTAGRDIRKADTYLNNGNLVKAATEVKRSEMSPAASPVINTRSTSINTEQSSRNLSQQITSHKAKGQAPTPPAASQPRNSPSTPTDKQEENVMSAFGNAIKMAALAREKRALEVDSGKSKAPTPPSSAAKIPPPPPGAPPLPPPSIPPATSSGQGSPVIEKKPVPAHVQKQLEETRKREESHAALLAAVAKRRNIVESVDREDLAESIETRIQRSRKLQTIVYKSDQSKPEVNVTTPPAAPVLAKNPLVEQFEGKKINDVKTPDSIRSHINNNNIMKTSNEEQSSPGHPPLTETKSNTDFLAAAEKARQQYLQKKQQATLERKTPGNSTAAPVESPSNTTNTGSNGKSPTKAVGAEAKNQTTLSDLAHIIAEKALERQRSTGGVLENHNNNNAASADTSSNSSLTLSSDGSVNAVELHGATTDFSHTDTPQSSRTTSFSGVTDDVLLMPVSARKRIFEARQSPTSKSVALTKDYHSNSGLVTATNKTNLAHSRPNTGSSVNGKAIHNGIVHLDGNHSVNVAADTNIEFIPPPPLFNGDAAVNGRAAHTVDDSVSKMSSMSTVSITSSADHSDSPPQSFSFDIVPPPPPPGFDDSPRTSSTDLSSNIEFIPPPLEFDSPVPVSPLTGTLKNVQKSNQSHSFSYPAVKTTPSYGGGHGGYREKDIYRWSSTDVASWLDSLQLGEFKETFIKNNVTGQLLTHMDRNKLISLGVTQVGHRMAIERAIKKAMIQ
ncbi:hypothetical protein LSH36_87g05016 [Paralvinella palmiformis]|uniref:SAM domain-containing protein n=1 Tax=Paralvinella palmiformis TaxID=53620 RepID=A0AAD9NAF7_9ANNE|nr:hypothetical protein LSH36_87g05016 [Paralvinella palmiformis]